MPDFSVRSNGIEIMDDLHCSGEVVNQTLRELDFINQWLGGNAITLDGLNTLIDKKPNPKKLLIADLGCGSGHMLSLINTWAAKKNIHISLLGIDANPNIIDYARKEQAHLADAKFEAIDIFSNEFKSKQFDVAIATLFFHHFTAEQLSAVLKQLHTQVRVGIIINDLHRHPLAYYSIKWLTQLFSRSAMVKFDAPLSVLRGFSRSEWELILTKAGIRKYTLRWRWAFRWQIIIPSLAEQAD